MARPAHPPTPTHTRTHNRLARHKRPGQRALRAQGEARPAPTPALHSVRTACSRPRSSLAAAGAVCRHAAGLLPLFRCVCCERAAGEGTRTRHPWLMPPAFPCPSSPQHPRVYIDPRHTPLRRLPRADIRLPRPRVSGLQPARRGTVCHRAPVAQRPAALFFFKDTSSTPASSRCSACSACSSGCWCVGGGADRENRLAALSRLFV